MSATFYRKEAVPSGGGCYLVPCGSGIGESDWVELRWLLDPREIFFRRKRNASHMAPPPWAPIFLGKEAWAERTASCQGHSGGFFARAKHLPRVTWMSWSIIFSHSQYGHERNSKIFKSESSLQVWLLLGIARWLREQVLEQANRGSHLSAYVYQVHGFGQVITSVSLHVFGCEVVFQLWLHKKLLQILAAKNTNCFILSHDFVGQEFRWVLAGWVFCFTWH